MILSELEEAVRERSLGIYSLRTLSELSSFVWSAKGKAEAQPGAHDDLVMSLLLPSMSPAPCPKSFAAYAKNLTAQWSPLPATEE
jgi:hypothetical protein